MAAYKGSKHPPQPAYQASPGSILNTDEIFYDSIAQAPRTPVDSFALPIRSGRAWTVPAGHIVRLSTPEGPQVGDLNIWNLHDPRERFWAARTRQLHQSHLSTYDRMWSCLPFLRPMVTIIADSLGGKRGYDVRLFRPLMIQKTSDPPTSSRLRMLDIG